MPIKKQINAIRSIIIPKVNFEKSCAFSYLTLQIFFIKTANTAIRKKGVHFAINPPFISPAIHILKRKYRKQTYKKEPEKSPD